MPEVTDAQLTEYHQYKAIAPTPAEVTRKLEDAIKDNGKQRDEIRDLKERVKAVPAEGAVVIPPGDEATEYAAWKALNLKPADVEKVTKERDALAEKVAATERETAFAKAARLSGLADEAVAAMLDMRSLDGATWEFKPVKVRDEKTGKDVDTEEVYVTLAGDGQTAKKFTELRESSPQLKGLPKAGSGTTEERGIVASEMRGAGGESKSVAGGIDDLIARNQQAANAGNPLKPAKAAA